MYQLHGISSILNYKLFPVHVAPPRGNTVTGAAEQGVDESQAVLIGSVVGAAVGLVLLGGAIIAIVVLLVVCLVYVSRRKLKASVVE